MSQNDLIEQLTSQRLSRSWNSFVCPACRRSKSRRHVFCVECWRQLPGHIQTKLFSSSRDAYTQGVLLAMRVLNRTNFHIEGELQPTKEQRHAP